MEKKGKKILVNICTPLKRVFMNKLDDACLKRDAYLDLILRHEAEKLDEEVPNRNSDAVRNYIAEQVNGLPQLRPVNLSLSVETAELITTVCDRKNTPRDAFINRVILLLLARPKWIE